MIVTQDCTENNPYYVGKLPNTDPQDAAFLSVLQNVPYIGSISSALIGSQLLKPGNLCVKVKKVDKREGWTTEKKLAVGAAFAALALGSALIFFHKPKTKK